MILSVFSVFDAKAALFGIPFTEQRDAVAIRLFSDAVNDGSNENNQWYKHPEDFSLFRIGSFDQESGRLSHITPESLITASAVRAVSREVSGKNGQMELALEK